ncbi:TIGR02444 family protein [Photobacterium sp. TY1-4]|uniref:TIGR02444 family protein n=1 Tax=Photobacterium sp. TY1-4 TaxID=2899122 RepID=UPI0021C0CF6A|nr:TIGR02444 family protein [Photobacterium sp. TY1-4]UXI01527.1 TIGR02444 family protein [Photobacterium sp. TY1-4]
MADAKPRTQPQPQTRPKSAGFWPFCLAHYAHPGVEAACLALQDRHHGNVNLALLLHWLDTQALLLPEDGLAQLDEALKDTDALLTSYRAMRRALKPRLDPAGYQQLLNFELTLEQRQQQALLTQLSQLPLRPAAFSGSPRQCGGNLHEDNSNLHEYGRHLGLPSALLQQLRGEQHKDSP